jgi:hypothetical protein
MVQEHAAADRKRAEPCTVFSGEAGTEISKIVTGLGLTMVSDVPQVI